MATDRLQAHWAGLGRTFGGIGKNLAAGLIGGLVAGGIMGISGRLNDIARSVASIGDEARRAGLGIEAFQELKYVAEQNRIGVDGLVDGIKELNLRADEFIATGGGSAAEAFQRMGYTAQDLATKLQDPSALFTEIIGKLGQLDRAAAIRIADEVFGGTGGERFVQLIDQGREGIEDTIREAHDLGLIMDEELIAKADELDRKFGAVAATVGTALKTAIVEAAGALQDFIAGFNNFLATAGGGTVGAGFGGNQPWSQLLTPEQRNRMVNLDLPLASLRNERTNFYEGFDFGPDGNIVLQPPAPPTPPVRPVVTPSTGGGGGGGGRSASSMREQRDAAAELIAELENELAILGMSEMEQRVNEELRRAGAFATDEQKASIRELVSAIETERGALERLEQATEQAKGITRDFLSGLTQDFRSGVDGATALANAFGRLGDRILDMALNAAVDALFANLGGGILGGLLGFKGGGVVEAASGGYIRGPGTGTSDSIPARLSDGEYVVNARATSRNLDLLEAINSGRIAQFASGGLAGNRISTGRDRPNVNIGDINITTQGSSGDPRQDREHAEMIGKQVDQALEKKMAQWAVNQSRPGGMFGDLRR
ncbi:phage tail tape measure protein [Pelagibacterium mangrovi]|uniref:phage tail tape measure protein n=1 Tax=Pelagibacterium mangrovi TaxID=3119828 RepID=UPI003F807B63